MFWNWWDQRNGTAARRRRIRKSKPPELLLQFYDPSGGPRQKRRGLRMLAPAADAREGREAVADYHASLDKRGERRAENKRRAAARHARIQMRRTARRMRAVPGQLGSDFEIVFGEAA